MGFADRILKRDPSLVSKVRILKSVLECRYNFTRLIVTRVLLFNAGTLDASTRILPTDKPFIPENPPGLDHHVTLVDKSTRGNKSKHDFVAESACAGDDKDSLPDLPVWTVGLHTCAQFSLRSARMDNGIKSVYPFGLTAILSNNSARRGRRGLSLLCG